jgi:hypothetical protein
VVNGLCAASETTGDLMNTDRPFEIPSWVPAAVAEEATRCHYQISEEKDPHNARAILDRLVTDQRMKSVYLEINKKKRINYQASDAFLHPAAMSHRSMAAKLR